MVARVRELGVKELFISGRTGEDYSGLGCSVLLDRQPGFGRLAGIESAMEACSFFLVLVLAVDLPHMSVVGRTLRRLTWNCPQANV